MSSTSPSSFNPSHSQHKPSTSTGTGTPHPTPVIRMSTKMKSTSGKKRDKMLQFDFKKKEAEIKEEIPFLKKNIDELQEELQRKSKLNARLEVEI
jgi:hypothetical protein